MMLCCIVGGVLEAEAVLQHQAVAAEGALAHRVELLVMRRVGRPRDGDLVNLHCYFHNLKIY